MHDSFCYLFTRFRGIINRVRAKDIKSCTVYNCYVRCTTLILRRYALPCTVRTYRQRSCNQRVDCLLCSVVKIYERYALQLKTLKVLPLLLLDGSNTNSQALFITRHSQNFQTKVLQSEGLLSAMQCGQDIRRAQVLRKVPKIWYLVVVRMANDLKHKNTT